MDNDLTTLDDRQLAERMAAGDPRAVAVLYDRYAAPAFSLALKLAGDPQLAAEVVQRAFQRVWEGARRLDAHAGRFASRLFSVVHYLAGDSPALVPMPHRGCSHRPPTGPLRPVPARAMIRRD